MAIPGFTRRCEISFAATTQADFPVLLTEDNLPSEMFDADGSYPALDGGGDIRFSSDVEGASQLPCEVVSFVTDNDPANGTAQVWVKVPAGSSIYVWYGKSGESQPAVTDTYGRNAVWSDFLHVYHLEAEPDGTDGELVDSSGNQDASFDGSAGTESEAGKIGNGLTLNGSSEAINSVGTLVTDDDWEVPGGHTNTGLTWNGTEELLAFVDWDNGEIIECDGDGVESTSINVGNGTDRFQGLAHDDSDNTYWICAYNDNEVQHFNRSGSEITADAISVTNANGVAYRSSTDQLYVLRDGSGYKDKVFVYDASSGSLDATITLSWIDAAIGTDHITIHESTGTMWISFQDETIKVYKLDGTWIGTFSNDVDYIEGLCFDGDGKLRVCHDGEYHGSITDGNRIYTHDVSTWRDAVDDIASGCAISAWVTPDTSTSTDAVFTLGEPIRGSGIGLYKLAASNDYRLYANSNAASIYATRSPGSGQKHLHFVFDPVADEMRLYSNGSIVSTAMSIAALASDVKKLRLYCGGDSEGRYFDCHVDELRVYDGIPSAAFIADEYETSNDPSSFASAGTPEAIQVGNPWHYYANQKAVAG